MTPSASPHMTSLRDSIQVNYLDEVDITCDVTANPAASVTWIWDDEILLLEQNQYETSKDGLCGNLLKVRQKLYSTDLSREDRTFLNGKDIVCNASNLYGTETSTAITLNMQCKFK